jgi:beta-phosphoglucomutase-like phosphatase (HAD superfamily)
VRAWQEAASAQQCVVTEDAVTEAMSGRTFIEVSEQLLGGTQQVAADPTLLELVALGAERRYEAAAGAGVAFVPDVVQSVREAGMRGVRLVVRADSRRRQVEALLELAGITHLVALLRCSDDPPASSEGRHRSPQSEAFYASWREIDRRLTGWGVGADQREIAEASEILASRARHLASRSTLSW